MIAKGNTAKEIGTILNMDSTSISREVKRNHIKSKEKDEDGTVCNDCLFKKGCNIVNVNKFHIQVINSNIFIEPKINSFKNRSKEKKSDVIDTF